jgi:[ribosomal protein S5]-alanine N-acetyltransferase
VDARLVPCEDQVPTTLFTERLILRALKYEDAEQLHVGFKDPAVHRYSTRAVHKTVEETRSYLRENIVEEKFLTWVLCEPSAIERPFGIVTLVRQAHSAVELGYHIHRERWGRGLGREAVGAVVKHGFESLCLPCITASTFADNAPSIALLSALAFRPKRRFVVISEGSGTSHEIILFGQRNPG